MKGEIVSPEITCNTVMCYIVIMVSMVNVSRNKQSSCDYTATDASIIYIGQDKKAKYLGRESLGSKSEFERVFGNTKLSTMISDLENDGLDTTPTD